MGDLVDSGDQWRTPDSPLIASKDLATEAAALVIGYADILPEPRDPDCVGGRDANLRGLVVADIQSAVTVRQSTRCVAWCGVDSSRGIITPKPVTGVCGDGLAFVDIAEPRALVKGIGDVG